MSHSSVFVSAVEPPPELPPESLVFAFSDRRLLVEPGETLEQAVEREVREETGIEVADSHDFGSQPWPFPSSLMIGFLANYSGGEITLDDPEIEDAGWYRPDATPTIPPRISIARVLIDSFLSEKT